MRADLAIRRSRAEDFDAWLALFEQVAAEGRWIGAEAPLDREWARRSFDRALDADHAITLIAEIDGLLVGLLGVTLAGGCADLGMMVRDGHRGLGIGSALMDACLAWSRGKVAHKVTLTVWPHNDRAIALYEKYGFVAEGRLVRYLRRRNGELWDAIPMGLVLDTTSPGFARPQTRRQSTTRRGSCWPTSPSTSSVCAGRTDRATPSAQSAAYRASKIGTQRGSVRSAPHHRRFIA